jgi:hypothetical protein
MLPIGLVALLIAITGGYLYLEWADAHEEVIIRVVNTRTGDASTYLARKKDVHGRSFETIDGRVITLADVERMELVGSP